MRESPSLISFLDVSSFLKRERRKIYISGIFFFTIALFFALSRPLQYEAQATFRDRKMTESEFVSTKLLLLKENRTQSESVTLFQSRQLAESVVLELDLQGTIDKKHNWGKILTAGLREKLRVEKAKLLRNNEPLPAINQRPLRLQEVSYPEEVSLSLSLTFVSEEEFIVKAKDGHQLGTGTISHPFHHDHWRFTVIRNTKEALNGQEYTVKLESLVQRTEKFRQNLHVAASKLDAGLILLSYKDENRHDASTVLNFLMTDYQRYLRTDWDQWTRIQIDYLEHRKNEAANNLQKLMDQHASAISSQLDTVGLFDLGKEIDFLAKQRLTYKQELRDTDLQLQRLFCLRDDATSHFSNMTCGLQGDSTAHIILSKIQELKQKRDLLELALAQVPAGDAESAAYSSIFKGMDLVTADQLYLEYSKTLDHIQKGVREQEFILEQCDQPDFEINSLSVLPQDHVTQNIVAKSVELALALRDENNRGVREQERIKEALSYQKKFLLSHLQQAIDLLHVDEKVTKAKIYSLQQMIVDLINRYLSVYEKNLKEHLTAEINNLQQERTLVEGSLKKMHIGMLEFPKRWVSEQMMTVHQATHTELVKEMAKIAAIKSLSRNLEIVQSTPIDIAIPPVLPSEPWILLFSLLGGTGGMLLTSGFLLVKGFFKGIPASEENLHNALQHVSGRLSWKNSEIPIDQLSDNNLNTLRKIVNFLYPKGSRQTDVRDVLVILGQELNYTPQLATLLAKREHRVLLLSLDPAPLSEAKKSPGLLQLLQKEVEMRTIKKQQEGYDYISAGWGSSHAVEIFSSPSFRTQLSQFHDIYDVIIATTQAPPEHPIAHSLASLFSHLLVTVSGQTKEELSFYTERDHTSFVFIDRSNCDE